MRTFDKNEISLQKYKEMLEYEEKLRKSDFIQKMYQNKNTDDTIITYTQKLVLKVFGYNVSEKDVDQYREAIHNFDRSQFNVFWIKHNIHKTPEFKVGDSCPISYLRDETGASFQFPHSFLKQKPLCVVASSDS